MIDDPVGFSEPANYTSAGGSELRVSNGAGIIAFKLLHSCLSVRESCAVFEKGAFFREVSMHTIS
jgi:hypothetical protein